MSITVSRMHRPNAHFTLISNDFIEASISPAAFRVACQVLKQPPGFVVTQERIGEALRMSRNTVAKAMRDLEGAGYLITQAVRDTRGHRIGSHLYVSDTGFTDEDSETLCPKIEHRDDEPCSKTEQPVLKNCAESCSKIEHHNKTVNKTKTKRETRARAKRPATPAPVKDSLSQWLPKVDECVAVTRFDAHGVTYHAERFRRWAKGEGKASASVDWLDARFLGWLEVEREDAPPRVESPAERAARLAERDKLLEEQEAERRAEAEARWQARKESPEQEPDHDVDDPAAVRAHLIAARFTFEEGATG